MPTIEDNLSHFYFWEHEPLWGLLYFWGGLLESPIIVVQKAAEPKYGVEFCQESFSAILCSLATSYNNMRCHLFFFGNTQVTCALKKSHDGTASHHKQFSHFWVVFLFELICIFGAVFIFGFLLIFGVVFIFCSYSFY